MRSTARALLQGAESPRNAGDSPPELTACSFRMVLDADACNPCFDVCHVCCPPSSGLWTGAGNVDQHPHCAGQGPQEARRGRANPAQGAVPDLGTLNFAAQDLRNALVWMDIVLAGVVPATDPVWRQLLTLYLYCPPPDHHHQPPPHLSLRCLVPLSNRPTGGRGLHPHVHVRRWDPDRGAAARGHSAGHHGTAVPRRFRRSLDPLTLATNLDPLGEREREREEERRAPLSVEHFATPPTPTPLR